MIFIMLRQLIYASSSSPTATKVALDPIYETSRHNNALDGITGLLFSDGYRFVQVLEGPSRAIEETMERIRADPRHDRIELLVDAPVDAREFGQWSMADRRRGERADEFDERLRLLMRNASARTRAAFAYLLEPA